MHTVCAAQFGASQDGRRTASRNGVAGRRCGTARTVKLAGQPLPTTGPRNGVACSAAPPGVVGAFRGRSVMRASWDAPAHGRTARRNCAFRHASPLRGFANGIPGGRCRTAFLAAHASLLATALRVPYALVMREMDKYPKNRLVRPLAYIYRYTENCSIWICDEIFHQF